VTDPCKSFLIADMPLSKINIPEIRNFLLNHTDPSGEQAVGAVEAAEALSVR
jgi:hypothetical protein